MPLTFEEFNKLATKQDLIDLENRLHENFASKKDFHDILSTMDYIVKKLDKIDSEQTANIGAHDRIEENIQKIDIRVKKLETAGV